MRSLLLACGPQDSAIARAREEQARCVRGWRLCPGGSPTAPHPSKASKHRDPVRTSHYFYTILIFVVLTFVDSIFLNVGSAYGYARVLETREWRERVE